MTGVLVSELQRLAPGQITISITLTETGETMVFPVEMLKELRDEFKQLREEQRKAAKDEAKKKAEQESGILNHKMLR